MKNKMKQKVRLSQCMIVKNEEKNIERALSWGKGIVWEQIVVDTGSTDKTVEIAERMGAKVYHFDWINDFAAAKNYAIGLAKGDWIAFLDADEYFQPEEAKKLYSYLEQLWGGQYNAIMTNWLQIDKDGKVMAGGMQTRIFRNIPGLCYKGRIHESIHMKNGTLNYVDACQELAIFHTGYAQSEDEDKRKDMRNLPLIQKELEEHPDDYNMMGYLGDAYFSIGDLEKAIEWYQKAIAYMPDKELDEYDIRSSITFWKLLTILMERKPDKEAALKVYNKAIKRLPKDADFDYIMGRVYAATGQFKKGAYHLQRSLELLEKFGISNKSMVASGNLMAIWEVLALCYLNNGDLAQCVTCTTTLLKENSYLMGTLQILLLAFVEDERREVLAGQMPGSQAATPIQVKNFLSNFYNFQSLKDILFVLKAAMNTQYEGLVREMKGLLTPEQLESFEKTMKE